MEQVALRASAVSHTIVSRGALLACHEASKSSISTWFEKQQADCGEEMIGGAAFYSARGLGKWP